MWHIWITTLQLIELLCVDNRIYKETSCVTLNMIVWQFGIANVDNALAQLDRRRILDTPLVQFGTNIAVVYMWIVLRTEVIGHVCDEVSIAPLTLEPTVAIGIATLLTTERHRTTRADIYCLDCLNKLIHLHPIRSDVLYGRGANIARNDREVFCAIQTMFNTISHDVVPHLSAAATQSAIVHKGNALDGRADHYAWIVTSEQKVASTPYYYIRCRTARKHTCHLLSFSSSRELQKPMASCVYAKSVMI